MGNEIGLLAITAASVGFIHTLTGPDHYIPFVAISKARNWNNLKTAIIVVICGLGHVGSSIVLGFVGVLAGIGLNKLVMFEGSRGDIAAWLIIIFGLIYGLWGLKKAYNFHIHGLHGHIHQDIGHSHNNKKQSYKQLTPWILFIIFVFGPCEPLIPLLIYPASEHNIGSVAFISTIFGLVTITTMLILVFSLLKGISFLKFEKLERYSHALAGFTILLCGIGIKFLGL